MPRPAPIERRGTAPPASAQAVVVGTGFGGLAAAVRLRAAGVRDLVLLERGDEVGGTWRDNTYPGCTCDVPSVLYSFSFAPNPDWTRRYASQPEIKEYLNRCAERFGLLPYIRFGTALESARWDGDAWLIHTSRGPVRAGVLICATGALAEPAYPDLPGLAGFTGEVVHTARWGPDASVAGRRVAVVGTGASAVQVVPAIVDQVAELTVYQRTPAWVQPRRDRPRWPWERALYRRLPATQRLSRATAYWLREATLGAFLGNTALRRAGERACRGHLHRQVVDPALREVLTPAYALGCKRVLLSDDYYPALTRPHVRVRPYGVVRVDGDRVVDAGGRSTTVDVLVLATGFRVTDNPLLARITGIHGRSLPDVWAGHPRAYLGTTVPGFPNFFLLAGPGTGIGHTSLVYMLEAQVDYVLAALRAGKRAGASTVEPTAEAYDRWNVRIDDLMRGTVWAAGGCRSWYQDATGRVAAIWPTRTYRFRRAARDFRAADHAFDPVRPTGASPAAPRWPATPPDDAVATTGGAA